jgi:RNA polymerase sigma-70 factor (ECF subfamily)
VEGSPTPSDEALVSRIQNGDTEQFGVLMERYEAKLRRYGRKFLSNQDDIQDIVQDVFISSYRNIQSFDVSQKFSSWIYRIAHNALVNGLKKHQRAPILSFDFDTLVSHTADEDPAVKERDLIEMRGMIDRGLGELPPKYREVLILYYLEEMPYKDIADILEVPTGTVGIRIKRAKEALRKAYEKLNMTYEEQ